MHDDAALDGDVVAVEDADRRAEEVVEAAVDDHGGGVVQRVQGEGVPRVVRVTPAVLAGQTELHVREVNRCCGSEEVDVTKALYLTNIVVTTV